MKKCLNCHKELEESKILIHERYCLENIKYCNECKEGIPKEEFEEHIKNHLKEEKKTCSNCKIELDNMKLLLHERYCIENIKYCIECNKGISKAEFEEHIKKHMLKKKEEEEKEELKKKEESERIECQYCGESMSYTLIDDHENMCGSRSDYCQICGQLLLVRNMRKHLKNHEFQNIMKLRKINCFELNSMNEDEMLARAMAESMFY